MHIRIPLIGKKSINGINDECQFLFERLTTIESQVERIKGIHNEEYFKLTTGTFFR
jgi:hypothetical protein